ncbi:phage holin [Enterococcus dongliensis]|uniref:Phage holin n=1 Tax=Enterococcus dongliensis TaxID=2559925 RepID=A0ABU3EQB8_9ENTE|nr:phage holin [Enterococcus dongliensis]MDT2597060.1 phage holin [Enterococcus dongliensis]
MKLSNKQYDFIKRFLTIGVPGITACIVTLGGLYGFDTKVIVGTITALATLSGVLLNVVSNNYDSDNSGTDKDDQENNIQ